MVSVCDTQIWSYLLDLFFIDYFIRVVFFILYEGLFPAMHAFKFFDESYR